MRAFCVDDLENWVKREMAQFYVNDNGDLIILYLF
jgi:hypothetical protein